MKATQSEPKAKGAEKNQRADDHMKGGKDMKAEGKEDRGGMKSEQKEEQTHRPGHDATRSKHDLSVTRPSVKEGRDQPSRDQKAQGQQDRMNQTRAEPRPRRARLARAESSRPSSAPRSPP